MNLVVLIGNVASDPEHRQTASGKNVASLRLAINRPGKNEADFFTCVFWESQADVVQEYVTKGSRIGVEGRLHHSTWESDQGKRSKVEIIASRIQLLGGSREDDTEQETTDSTAEPVGFTYE